MQANDRDIQFSKYDSTKREQLSYLNADSPHKLCCTCRSHNKNIITHNSFSCFCNGAEWEKDSRAIAKW